MKKKPVYTEECIHGIYPGNCCTICNGHDSKSVEERVFIVARFHAKFYGKCYRCGSDINPGDKLAQTTNDEYLCTECAPDDDT